MSILSACEREEKYPFKYICQRTPIAKEEGIVIVFVMSQSDMWFIYICSSLMVVRLRRMCFYILTCAFQSGGLCRRLDGGVMAVFNKGEMCVFCGGWRLMLQHRENERDGAEIEH